VLANRALAYLKINQFANAEEDCTASIANDPKYVKSYLRRGHVRISLNKIQGAIDDFQAGLKLDPASKELSEELKKAQHLLQSNPKEATTEPVKPTEKKPSENKPSPEIKPATESKPLENKPTENTSPAEVKVPITINKHEDNKSITEKQLPKPSENIPSSEIKPATGSKPLENIPTESKTKPVESKPIIKVQEISSEPLTISIVNKPAKPVSKNTPKPKNVIVAPIIKPTVPLTLPTTAYEFERDWNTLRVDKDALFKYTRLIPAANYIKILSGESITDEIFSGLLDILAKYYIPQYYEDAYKILLDFSTLSRLDILCMFLSSSQKSELSNLLEQCYINFKVNNKEIKQEDFNALKNKYGLSSLSL